MILLINGSMRGSTGNTAVFLRVLEEMLNTETQTVELRKYQADPEPLMESIEKADAVVLGSPLYVDGYPSNVLRLLEHIHDNCKGRFSGKPIYGLSNLGFWEGQQIYLQHQILAHFCRRTGMQYSGSIGIGAGPFMRVMMDKGIRKGPSIRFMEGMEQLAQAITNGETMENIYTKPHVIGKKGDLSSSTNHISRFFYIRIAHFYWMQEAKKSGLKRKDIVKFNGKYMFD